MINLRRIFDAAVREGFRKALDTNKSIMVVRTVLLPGQTAGSRAGARRAREEINAMLTNFRALPRYNNLRATMEADPGTSDDCLPSHPGAGRPSRPANLEMDSLGGRS